MVKEQHLRNPASLHTSVEPVDLVLVHMSGEIDHKITMLVPKLYFF